MAAGLIQILASQLANIEVHPSVVSARARTKMPPAKGRRERGRREMVLQVVGNLACSRRTREGSEMRFESAWETGLARLSTDSSSISSGLTASFGLALSLQMSRSRAMMPAGAVTIHTSTFPPLTKLVPTSTARVTPIKVVWKTAPLGSSSADRGATSGGSSCFGM